MSQQTGNRVLGSSIGGSLPSFGAQTAEAITFAEYGPRTASLTGGPMEPFDRDGLIRIREPRGPIPATLVQCAQGPLAGSSPAYARAKRALDIVVSSLAILLLSPVGLIIALLIFLEDRGPIFYSQDRVGQNGRRFKFYKFRSMVCNADSLKTALEAAGQNEASGPVFKMKNDPRVTRTGRVLRKWSLDELPQFYNVLRGDMTLVGPRPHLPKEVAKYVPGQESRLTVQPGLICLREVTGRSNLTFERWIALDLLYIEHRSLALDLFILLMAVPAILKAEGAY